MKKLTFLLMLLWGTCGMDGFSQVGQGHMPLHRTEILMSEGTITRYYFYVFAQNLFPLADPARVHAPLHPELMRKSRPAPAPVRTWWVPGLEVSSLPLNGESRTGWVPAATEGPWQVAENPFRNLNSAEGHYWSTVLSIGIPLASGRNLRSRSLIFPGINRK